MGIRVDSGQVQPQIVFDRVHVSNLSITQPTFTNDTLPPKYSINIEYLLYGVDVHQQRHYKGGTYETTVEDFIAEAMKYASLGDMTLATALPAIEQAVAFIIQKDIDMNTKVV